MNNFFKAYRRCLNPWVLGLIILVIIGLTIIVPILGATALIAALPLMGCTFMCGAMAFMMRGEKRKNKND